MKHTIVALAIDDFNPGLIYPNGKEEKLLRKLFLDYPKIKVTCFCSPAYSYTNNKHYNFLMRNIPYLRQFYKINKKNLFENNSDWIKYFKKIKNIQLEIHGFSHYNPIKGNAQEFFGLNKKQTSEKISVALNEFLKVGIKPKVFSPPGWGMNPHIIKECNFKGLNFAGTFYDQNKKTFSGKQMKSGFKIEKYNSIKIIPRNLSIADKKTKNIKFAAEKGIINFQAHAKNIGVTNGITVENIKNLREKLDFIKENYKIDYRFFSEF